MAGLEDFYPELRGKLHPNHFVNGDNMDRPASGPPSASLRKPWDASPDFVPISASTPKTTGRVPLLIEKPPRLVTAADDDNIGPSTDSYDADHYAHLGIGAVGLVLQNVLTHPFIVLRRQCQVSSESYRHHRTPITLIPVVVTMYRHQGLSCMWKGLGSALTVRGLILAVEDCTGKFTPWPTSVDSTSSLRMVGQHLLLKAVSQALVVPFFSASLVESVQSEIASEKPGIFDFFKEGLMRLGPQSGSRTLPMWLLIPPTVLHSLAHYIISTIVKTISGKILRVRHRAVQEQRGAISKPSGAPPGLSQYREQMSSVIGFFMADVILYPIETVLQRLHLQGTRTIIDNLDTGREVMPIITRYEGFADCFHSIVNEEGVSGLFRGFGALMLQYAVQIALLRLSFVSIKEVLRLINNPHDMPPLPKEYLEMHTPEVRPHQQVNPASRDFKRATVDM